MFPMPDNGPRQGAETAVRPPVCRGNLPDPGKGIAPSDGTRKRTAFPPPLRETPPTGPAAPGPAEGQRPPGAVRVPTVGFGPPGWAKGQGWRWHREDGRGHKAQGARRRKSVPLFGQPAHRAGTLSTACQNLVDRAKPKSWAWQA